MQTLLGNFEKAIRQSVEEARRDAWFRAYQADPDSENFRKARESVARRWGKQANSVVEAQQQVRPAR